MAKSLWVIVIILLAVTVGLQQWTIREYKDACRLWKDVAATYQEAWVEDGLYGQWPEGMTPIREVRGHE